MKPARIVLPLMVLVGACADRANPDVSYQFRETALRQLVGVELGMPARNLKSSRPNVIFAPNLGFKEVVPGSSVSYEFKTVTLDPDLKEVPPSDLLRGIYMSSAFETSDEAIVAWRGAVREITKSRRAPESCMSFPGGGEEARWFSGSMSLVVGVFPPAANSAVIGHRMITALTTIEAMRKPPGGTPIPCPTS